MELIKGVTQISLKLDKIDQNILGALKEINGVAGVEMVEDMIAISGENVDNLLADIITKVTAGGRNITSINVKKPNLETVFLHLTGKALRD